MPLPYKQGLIPLAKNLRTNATRQEKHLWYDFLNGYPIRFQRQKAIDHYIADFFCAKVKLVIELDGSQHFTNEGKSYDAGRSSELEKLGITVIRFTNEDIDKRFDSVCQYIDHTVKCLLEKERETERLSLEGAGSTDRC